MNVYDWPASVRVRGFRPSLESNSRSFESPFTGDEQVVDTLGSKWVFEVVIGQIKDLALASRFSTRLESVGGRKHCIKLYDFSRPRRAVLGAPVVNESLAMRRYLTSRGWTPSKLVLAEGDWLQIGNELKRVKGDVLSDASGRATINIEPELRATYASGTPLLVERPMGLFRIDDKLAGKGMITTKGADFGTIRFREALYP